MFKKIVLISAISMAFSSLACAVGGPTGTTKPTPPKPTSTTPAPTKPTSPPQTPQTEKPHGNSMPAPAACKSGSRVFSYDYDTKTGVISASTTFDKCVLPNGTSITGASSTSGTLLATGETGYAIDLTDQIDTTITEKSGLAYTRKCTIVRKGTLDTKTQVFSGSIQRNNCGLSGDFREPRGLIEHLLKQPTNSEESNTDNPPPAPTDNTGNTGDTK